MPALLATENMPFAVALAFLGLLVLVQAMGLGHYLHDVDLDADGHDLSADLGGGLASLMGFGRVPMLIWLSCFCASFGLIGLSLQQLFANLFGAPFHAAPAAGVALVAAVPANAVLTRLIGAVWPRDETTAVSLDALVGRRGTIAIGTASRGSPARATVHDEHGQMHNVMVEPHNESSRFLSGDEILLVRRDGDLFYALDGQGPIRLID